MNDFKFPATDFPPDLSALPDSPLMASEATLRDYFAGQALIGWRENSITTIIQDAETAYKLSDAMMEARNK